ncbi:alkane 1-monooxygenase [Oricola cellulosilytica]|uniref:Alkane 1-monooxygenase n=1 Tax=Oricola cellulosilytica TaxID=1429082 RepID=A0A4V6N6B2_9HYPH|nr:alkane 1-monooxygenase [Oricola cellulosilytica]TCD14257.1 alkane 1-monooxygenase [Oricola cellulosilytica]
MIFVATTRDGDEIRYRDTKRYLWWLSVAAPAVLGVSAILLWQTGALFWAAFPLLFFFVAVPVLDMLFGEDANNPPEEVVEDLSGDSYYRVLLFCSIPVLWFSFVTSAVVAATMELPVLAYVALALAAGSTSGGGLTVGHELGHKTNALDQWGAKLACALTGYSHFCIEHNRGHHSQVATPEDPASARLGESVYRFALREIPGAARRGWALERTRLERKGLSFWHWKNNLLQGYAVALAVAAILIAFLGWAVVPFLVIHHVFGWLQLTQANYVEHYGLKRERRPNGRYEPCQPRHSWNTNHIVSNLMLFHLQRHSDHHANPMRPYQALRDFEELPRLPSGYPGCFVLAAIPPLWRAVMDPKVLRWADGDLSRTNVAPGHEALYATRFASTPAGS